MPWEQGGAGTISEAWKDFEVGLKARFIPQEETPAAEEAVLGHVGYLPDHDRDIFWKVLVLQAQGRGVIEQAHAMAFTDALAPLRQ